MLRVRPGVLLVRAIFLPTSALMTLDLPTLDRPRKAISGTPGAGKCVKSLADSMNCARIRMQTVSSVWVAHGKPGGKISCNSVRCENPRTDSQGRTRHSRDQSRRDGRGLTHTLQRCDNWPFFNTGFSRRGKTAARKTLFPQPPRSYEAQPNPAPEGRPNLAQRFSAGKSGKKDSSPGGTAELSRKPKAPAASSVPRPLPRSDAAYARARVRPR